MDFFKIRTLFIIAFSFSFKKTSDYNLSFFPLFDDDSDSDDEE